MRTPGTGGGRPRPSSPGRLRRLLELFGLCGFVFSQPVLDIMGRSPQYFVFVGAGRRDLVLLTVVLVVAPPLALWSVELLLGAVIPKLVDPLHRVFVGALLAALALLVGKNASSLRGPFLLLLATFVGAGLFLGLPV